MPSKDEVDAVVDGPVSSSWFAEYQDGGVYFDFDKLDQLDLNEYVSKFCSEDRKRLDT